jgi:hypothetical protein
MNLDKYTALIITAIIIYIVLPVRRVPIYRDVIFEPGDIILTDGNNRDAVAIRAYNNSNFNHMGIVNSVDEKGVPTILHFTMGGKKNNGLLLRSDTLGGKYYSTWADTMWIVKARDIYKDQPYIKEELQDYDKYMYGYVPCKARGTMNCNSFVCHVLGKYGTRFNRRHIALTKMKTIIRQLIDDGLFVEPELVYSRMPSIDMLYLDKWFLFHDPGLAGEG